MANATVSVADGADAFVDYSRFFEQSQPIAAAIDKAEGVPRPASPAPHFPLSVALQYQLVLRRIAVVTSIRSLLLSNATGTKVVHASASRAAPAGGGGEPPEGVAAHWAQQRCVSADAARDAIKMADMNMDAKQLDELLRRGMGSSRFNGETMIEVQLRVRRMPRLACCMPSVRRVGCCMAGSAVPAEAARGSRRVFGKDHQAAADTGPLRNRRTPHRRIRRHNAHKRLRADAAVGATAASVQSQHGRHCGL